MLLRTKLNDRISCLRHWTFRWY